MDKLYRKPITDQLTILPSTSQQCVWITYIQRKVIALLHPLNSDITFKKIKICLNVCTESQSWNSHHSQVLSYFQIPTPAFQLDQPEAHQMSVRYPLGICPNSARFPLNICRISTNVCRISTECPSDVRQMARHPADNPVDIGQQSGEFPVNFGTGIWE